MLTTWLISLFNLLFPRHVRAERARTISDQELVSLLAPTTLTALPWVHAVLPYHDERVRALIQAVKYYGEKSLAHTIAPYAADYLLEVLSELRSYSGWQHIILVPIPSSARRLRERGYNQAALFARAIHARVPDTTYNETLLHREHRASQVHVGVTQRRSNVGHAFHANQKVAGACIVLIDDVVKSGATLTDARNALLDAGAKDVIALALAH
jgi:ComF family protein